MEKIFNKYLKAKPKLKRMAIKDCHKLEIENDKKNIGTLKLKEEIESFKKYGIDTSSLLPCPDNLGSKN